MPSVKDTAAISSEEMLLAEAADARETTTENAFASPAAAQHRSSEHEGATVTHSSPGLRRAYKPTPLGYMPRNVSASNLPMLIRQGWLAACPDCGRANCGVDGNLNDCTGRPNRAYRTCPIDTCGYQIWDPLPIGVVAVDRAADPNEIKDGLADQSTPASRTEALWRAHILGYHPQEAPTYGVYTQVGMIAGMQPQVGEVR